MGNKLRRHRITRLTKKLFFYKPSPPKINASIDGTVAAYSEKSLLLFTQVYTGIAKRRKSL
jgi:hypothetical protein